MFRTRMWKVAASLLLTMAVMLTTMPISDLFAYQNGTSIEEQWANATVEYGVGDPFIMKYNGTYYLYVSSLDGEQGIKVWSSENMVDWKYEGLCNENDSVITGAYAPEVTYWNGTFYLYTAAPGGEQHRVLTSDSPTGPFVRRGDVLSDPNDLIDGSVYIDDNTSATKYFLHAGGSCIEYSILNRNMLTGGGKYTIPAATILGTWTEGPSVFKRNGKYYMTYTGNHVCADNYMIEYAVGDRITNLQEPEENLLLINTEEGITGLGHNSTVVGPDLDTRYIIYHSLVSNTSAPERRLNIDRIVFNGEKMEVQGPTWWEMDNPKLPEFSDRMANADNWSTVSGKATVQDGAMTISGSGEVRAKETTPADYTAEFNLWIGDSADNAKAGATVSYQDDHNYACVYLEPESNKVFLQTCVQDAITTTSAALPSEYAGKEDVLRKITVKKQGNTFDIYVDDRLLLTASAALSGGYIGLKTENCTAKFGYTAFSSTVNGNQDKDSVKPTGSAMDAVLSNSASWNYETGILTESGAGLESLYVKGMAKENSLTFKINPQETSYYSAEICAKAQAGTRVSIAVDGQVIAKEVSLTKSDVFMTDVVRNLKIAQDAKEVTLTVTAGSMDFYSLKLAKEEDVYTAESEQADMNFEWLDGTWKETSDTISTVDASTWSVASYGNENWGDYEIEADVNLKNGSDAGLLVRLKYATDSSDAKDGIGACKSADYHYGYYAYLNPDGVSLGKQMFDWKVLDYAPQALFRNQTYRLKVRAEGANIKVWLDDKLMIDYTDTDQPILSGKIGMRVFLANADFQNIHLTHLHVATPLNGQATLATGATAIHKNTFQLYSNAAGKGYEIKDGGIDFNNGLNRSIKGVLTADASPDGIVACDLQLPGTGGFGAGLLVRCKRSAFGDGVDELDGLGVQLERGENGSVNLKVYEWENKAWKGVVAETNLENYFADQMPRTVHLAVNLQGDSMDVYVDGIRYLTVNVEKWTGDDTRTAIGFRSHNSAHVMLTNFAYGDEASVQPNVTPAVTPEIPATDGAGNGNASTSDSGWILFVIVAIVVLVAAGGVAFFLLKKR